MEVSFKFDLPALVRDRYLRLVRGTGRYSIPPDPVYKPVRGFLDSYSPTGYRFNMLSLLHAAAVKMLGLPSATKYNTTLFAAGGLSLALDPSHPDLAVRPHFGDFTSGFSHQFGVALSIMSMSEAFSIPWDQLTPIPVYILKRRVLDYHAPIPNERGWLMLEAKGATSDSSRDNARSRAYRKKLIDPKRITSAKLMFDTPTAMIGVIAQAARSHQEQGILEIIDPSYEIVVAARQRDNQIAGRHLHYGGVARFAGLHNVAGELIRRADALVRGQMYDIRYTRQISFEDDACFSRFRHELVGMQWRLGESDDPNQDVWLYHGVDTERIKTIVTTDEFPPARPYYSHEGLDKASTERDRFVESLFPDGSFLGIGLGPREDMKRIDRQKALIEWPIFAHLF